MSIRWLARGVCVLTFAMTLGACVTLPANAPRSKQDPWESWNRGVYRFNDSLDRHIAKPVAKGYVKVVPHPIRTGVSNFFANLKTTTVMVNDALQGKFKKAANDLGRLVLNTTVGLGGILDPATPAGLDKNDNDFGLTLGVWGLHPGPFVELPILGPSDVRDTFGRVVDTYTDPRQYVKNTTVRYVSYVPYYIDRRAALLPLDETLRNAFDPYAVIRDAYLANRAFLTGHGATNEEEPLLDPDAGMNESSPHSSPAPGGAGPMAAPSAPQPGAPPPESSQAPAPAQTPPAKGSPPTEPPEEPPL
ncbi:MAG TPA: VacJ family lipoprotein [Steroidobacteraceae bacterium]|nr:VacJ family lipoprotein [Steroidobacteraceae bacterium]